MQIVKHGVMKYKHSILIKYANAGTVQFFQGLNSEAVAAGLYVRKCDLNNGEDGKGSVGDANVALCSC